MRWPLYRIDRLADVYGGGTPSRNDPELWGGDIPWITPSDLPMLGEGIAAIHDALEHITNQGLNSSAATLMPHGSVLFSSRATIGKIGIAHTPLTTNQGFVNLVPRKGVESKYLAYCLLRFADDIARLAGSTTFREVTRGNFRSFRIPLPATSEQGRIVDLLEQADGLRQSRAEADQLADRILPALFHKMFGDPSTNPKGFPTRSLRELTAKYSDGPFGSNLKSDHYVEHGVRVVRLQNIGVGRFLDEDKAFISEDHFANLSKHECKPGDVLIGTLGDPNLRACVQPNHIRLALNKADCVQFRANRERCTPEYACWLLNSPRTLALAGGLIAGQTRPRISMGRLASLVVPEPPLSLQQRFSEMVRSFQTTNAQMTITATKVERLFQVLLHRAFTGELTAKWREAHMKELLAQMAQQARLLNLPTAT